MNIALQIAKELNLKQTQVEAAIQLLDDGATVPFIARYRKEVTAGLDDSQLRNLEERLVYIRELEERRQSILKLIDEQGKLTEPLKQAILAADTKTRLEDLYAPYKVKRRTKAQIAREAGIEPLLDLLLTDPNKSPEENAKQYINEKAGFKDSAAVLEGARQIFMERISEDADLIGRLREFAWDKAILTATQVQKKPSDKADSHQKSKSKKAEKQDNSAKFKDYFDYQEQYKKIPSHRALALFRGRSEGVLRLKMQIPGQDDLTAEDKTGAIAGICEHMIAKHFKLEDNKRAADTWLLEGAAASWRIKISLHIETELNLRLRESAEEEAIRVFGENLRDLLLAAPAGGKAVLGLDPGLRTGVKVVALDHTGKLLEHTTIYPHAPKNQWDESIAILATLIQKHNLQLVSIGNGTASRETDKLIKDLIRRHPEIKLHSLVVSEAGASVYSASKLATAEFPDLDVSLRGAVSIARRLQDPLAELVKIEPKSIGVGQYQHDVNQSRMARKLDAVVEDCVNAVGVEINTASVPLLARVAGLNQAMANNIVSFREENGAFDNRNKLLEVPRLGPKAYEQAAGFLRIHNGNNPLDASAVHPEAYPLVEKILNTVNKELKDIIGDSKFLATLTPQDFIDEQFGEPTVRDIIQELEKPGRDPRPEFKTASFKEGVETISDLKPNMQLEGVITNVTNFGAFVDIGVHQDGLVHISALSETYVKDPREVVKAGDIVKVKVLEVDNERNRIALTMCLNEKASNANANKNTQANKSNQKPRHKHNAKSNNKQKKNNKPNHHRGAIKNTAMADALAKLKQD